MPFLLSPLHGRKTFLPECRLRAMIEQWWEFLFDGDETPNKQRIVILCWGRTCWKGKRVKRETGKGTSKSRCLMMLEEINYRRVRGFSFAYTSHAEILNRDVFRALRLNLLLCFTLTLKQKHINGINKSFYTQIFHYKLLQPQTIIKFHWYLRPVNNDLLKGGWFRCLLWKITFIFYRNEVFDS